MYVDFFSDHDARTSPGSRLWAAGRWFVIATSKKQADRWLVQFVDMKDRNESQLLSNIDLYGEPIDDPETLWVHEMIGSRVVGVDGTEHGTCVAVIDNPAHPIIELDNGFLVPTPFVVAHENGRITIDPPEGLFES